MIDSIILDVDGTLWDSTPEFALVFNIMLGEGYPEIKEKVTAEQLRKVFGLTLDVIGAELFQSVPKEQAEQMAFEFSEQVYPYLAEHGAMLYEGWNETMKALSEKYKLFIVSNCQEGYIQCFFKAYPHLEQYITDFEYPGRSGKLKAENIKMVMERNQLKSPIYVGDTKGDAKAAKEAGVPFIYARYGFGEVKEYDDVIDSPIELLSRLL
ncbi:MAG: HAD family hydrolase [Mobilitalea sp.]